MIVAFFGGFEWIEVGEGWENSILSIVISAKKYVKFQVTIEECSKERGERQRAGGGCGCERNCGYHPRNTLSRSPSNTLVRVCNNKCAPFCDHCICCRLTKRLLTT